MKPRNHINIHILCSPVIVLAYLDSDPNTIQTTNGPLPVYTYIRYNLYTLFSNKYRKPIFSLFCSLVSIMHYTVSILSRVDVIFYNYLIICSKNFSSYVKNIRWIPKQMTTFYVTLNSLFRYTLLMNLYTLIMPDCQWYVCSVFRSCVVFSFSSWKSNIGGKTKIIIEDK